MKKKVISLIGILWACLCVVFVIIILKYNVKGIINSVFPPEEIQELNLTEEEKLEDFFHNVIGIKSEAVLEVLAENSEICKLKAKTLLMKENEKVKLW